MSRKKRKGRPMASSPPIIEKPTPTPETPAKSVEVRLGDLEKEFVVFQSRIDVIVSMLKWIGGFVAAALLAVVLQMFSVTFAAGRLQEKVDAQGVTIQEMKTELREIKKELAAQGVAIQEMKAEIRDSRKDLALIRDELKKITKDK
jgi:DNA repair exonuclease SbcCD ATPase subunit